MLAILFVACAVVFAVAFFTYGRFLERRFDVDDNRPTPSHTEYDGVDRVPAHPAVLFGHHFSSIAGAGPIVGPIVAALAFGWAFPLAWILLGSVFIGGVHDFSALIASVRNRARSVADIARESLSPLAYRLLMLFMWLTLVYVLAVFTDLTATTFVQDGGVATSSWMFLVLAVLFGLSVYRLRMPIRWASLIFVPLVFLCVWLGQLWPIPPAAVGALTGWDPALVWSIILLLYCLLASVTPVWVLLQPRDYLSSFLLYASLLAGLLGILLGGFDMQFPAFITWHDEKLGSLFPILFITIACGACSGFHSLVASGTTSKQLDKERHARTVGYGAMLVEGLVAVIALATITSIGANPTDAQVATARAVKNYVDGQITQVNTGVSGAVANVSYANKSISVQKGTGDPVTTALQGLVDGASYDGSTGVLTLTTNGGTPVTVNLPVENFLSAASFNATTNVLTLTLTNGETVTVSLADLVDTYTGANGATANVSIAANGAVSASVNVSAQAGNIIEAKSDGIYAGIEWQSLA